MKNLRSAFTSLAFVAAATAPVAFGLLLFSSAPAVAAETPAGTSVTNTATASYGDGSGTTYNTQSNTVTTTVQNAPALTIAPPQSSPGANQVSPGGTLTDTYTLTNVGNGAGYFQLTGTQNVNDGVTAGQGTFNQYVVQVPTQSAQTFASIAAANTYLATGNSGGPWTVPASNGVPNSTNQIAVGVTYTANAGASGTITTLLTPNITQIAVGSAPAATSSTVIGQYNDPVVVDARMDVQKTAAVGGTPAAPTVTYTLKYNNGGARPMLAVKHASLPAGSYGAGADGIIVTDQLPSYNSTQLTLNGTPSFTTQPTGSIFVYSVDGVTWTTTTTGAVYVGVFIPSSAITGSFGASNPGSSHGSVPTPQLAFTFTINGSTAAGGANPTAITNVANSVYGDSSGYIEGPGLALDTLKNDGTTTPSQIQPAINNANGSLTGSTSVQSAAAPAGNSVLNGPNGAPGAVGQTGTADDYTAASYTDGGNACCTGATNGGNNETVPASAATIKIVNSIQNTGNKDDVYNLTTTTLAADLNGQALPAGWTAQFQNDTTHAVITSVAVPSGTTVQYDVIFTPPASATTFVPFTPYGVAIVATSTNDNTKSNNTNDEFFVGGFVKMTKTVGDAAGQGCATASTFTSGATASPGDCLLYTVTYLNVAPSGGTGDVTLNASSFAINEDGTGSGSTNGTGYTNVWATYTSGLYAAPVDSNGGTLGGYSGAGAVGSTKFTDTVGALSAGATGNVAFKAQLQ
jgi:hypothetical protein